MIEEKKMHALAFLKGIVIALIISIPLGPMALLCIKRTYRDGFWAGWATSLGIALGDTVFAIIAGFSLSFMLAFIHAHERIVNILGIIFLLLFGIYTIYSKLHVENPHERHVGFIKSLSTSFLLTLSNILGFVGVIALISWLTATKTYGNLDVYLLAAGVFIGVLTWFSGINFFVHVFKEKLKVQILNRINKYIGFAICSIAIIMIIRLFL